jgi:hypothetical protein
METLTQQLYTDQFFVRIQKNYTPAPQMSAKPASSKPTENLWHSLGMVFFPPYLSKGCQGENSQFLTSSWGGKGKLKHMSNVQLLEGSSTGWFLSCLNLSAIGKGTWLGAEENKGNGLD